MMVSTIESGSTGADAPWRTGDKGSKVSTYWHPWLTQADHESRRKRLLRQIEAHQQWDLRGLLGHIGVNWRLDVLCELAHGSSGIWDNRDVQLVAWDKSQPEE